MSNNPQPMPSRPKGPKMPINYWLYAVVVLSLIGMYMFLGEGTTKREYWSDFEQYATKGWIEDVTVYSRKSRLEATVKVDSAAYIYKSSARKSVVNSSRQEYPKLVVNIPSADGFNNFYNTLSPQAKQGMKVDYDSQSDLWDIIVGLIPFAILIFLWIFIFRRMSGGSGVGGGGGIFSVGKSKAQLYDQGNGPKVTFQDVAGLSEAKEEIEEIVSFLKNPKRYTELGGKIPKGALLVGPPGTGKTLLAKAVAGEANVPFFSMSGSDFVEMFVGVGASRVRDLFAQAKAKSPCIIFIDEIDAIGRARGKNPSMGGNDERENTLNQLLTEMDGFGTNSGIIILAATNRVDILDKALLRAGRFDRQIYVDLPDFTDRKAIFKVHLRGVKSDDSIDIDFLARQTPGFSGADIANVCNEAALIAARKGKNVVQKDDFLNAVDRIVGGLEKKSKITTLEERKAIAVHEAGHATISWFLQYADPLVKVTIVPRGKALGAAWYLPEERQIETKAQMLDKICALLGGRAAEEVFLGHISSGAANDLERTTKLIYAMVAYYGMSDSLPNISYYDSSGQDYGFTKPYSDQTAQKIDQEVSSIVSEQYQRAKELLRTHAAGHNELAEILLTREVIYSDDLVKIFGKRPWISRNDEIQRELTEREEQHVVDSSTTVQEKETTPPLTEDNDNK